LNDILSNRRYLHSSLTTSGWCRGVELYDDETVTSAALDGYGSVWELNRGLAMYEKHRRKNWPEGTLSFWYESPAGPSITSLATMVGLGSFLCPRRFFLSVH
jgi:hypothetical protein